MNFKIAKGIPTYSEAFINELESFLPSRKKSNRGRPPVPVRSILYELFKLVKTNCGWRNIKHKTVCYNYYKEIQRRGLLQKFLNVQTIPLKKIRQPETIIDSSDVPSFKVKPEVKYSGKYHNNCYKMTVEVTIDLVPMWWSIDKGTASDSKILDKRLRTVKKLPYELYLDKGYERYERRRDLQQKNCQVRMEMKKGKNRKKGKRFQFTEEQKQKRYSIEKIFGWLKSFMVLRLNRMRRKANLVAAFLLALNYYTYCRLNL